MDNEQQLERFRQVTKILADLDLLFSISSNPPDQDRLWDLLFSPDPHGHPQSAVAIRLGFNGPWFVVLSATQLDERPNVDTLMQLFRINLMAPGAKVTVSEFDMDGTPAAQLIVSTEISESRVDTESVKEAIGAVVAATRKAYEVIGRTPMQGPLKSSLEPPDRSAQ